MPGTRGRRLRDPGVAWNASPQRASFRRILLPLPGGQVRGEGGRLGSVDSHNRPNPRPGVRSPEADAHRTVTFKLTVDSRPPSADHHPPARRVSVVWCHRHLFTVEATDFAIDLARSIAKSDLLQHTSRAPAPQ